MGIRIGSRDWQDLLELQERIATALETIAGQLSSVADLKEVTAKVIADTKQLQDAIPK